MNAICFDTILLLHIILGRYMSLQSLFISNHNIKLLSSSLLKRRRANKAISAILRHIEGMLLGLAAGGAQTNRWIHSK